MGLWSQGAETSSIAGRRLRVEDALGCASVAAVNATARIENHGASELIRTDQTFRERQI